MDRARQGVVLVVASSILARFKTVAIAAAVATGLLSANPALANNSNADIAAPLRAAQGERASALGSGDEEFRRLFASWQSAERSVPVANGAAAPIRRSGASIPSLMPLQNAAMTSGYGSRIHPVLGGRRGHRGIDLGAPTGTPIRATADGTISRADWFSSYGLYVSIEHGGQIETRYGHMSRLNVAAGQQVRKGDVIGYVGSTGRSTGPHLHYEVRIAGQAVNPVPYMQGTLASASGGQGGE
jgi:murein DD-endopeptidase MepM/ murein hydrolase activator NlpD